MKKHKNNFKKIVSRAEKNLKAVEMNETKRILIPSSWRKLINLEENNKATIQLIEDENGNYGMLVKPR